MRLDLRVEMREAARPFVVEEIRYEKSLARPRFGSCRIVVDHSDYGSLLSAAHVSLGSRACGHAGNEREVPVGLIYHPMSGSLTSIGRRSIHLIVVGVIGLNAIYHFVS
jgi:hypothetical protein